MSGWELFGFVYYQGFFVSFLIPFIIDIAAVTVNSSYLNMVFSGNTKLENIIAKPQQQVAFIVLSQLFHVANVDFTSS